MAVVYCLTNKVNGKMYIGQTRNGLSRRLQSHTHSSTYFGNAIRKYSITGFDIIENDIPHEIVDSVEINLIAFFNTKNPQYGYNIQKGGHHWSPDSSARMSSSHAGSNNPNWKGGIVERKRLRALVVEQERIERKAKRDKLERDKIRRNQRWGLIHIYVDKFMRHITTLIWLIRSLIYGRSWFYIKRFYRGIGISRRREKAEHRRIMILERKERNV